MQCLTTHWEPNRIGLRAQTKPLLTPSRPFPPEPDPDQDGAFSQGEAWYLVGEALHPEEEPLLGLYSLPLKVLSLTSLISFTSIGRTLFQYV